MPVTLQRQGPVTLDRGLLPWTGGIVCRFQSLTEYSILPSRYYMYSNPCLGVMFVVIPLTVVLNSWSWAHFFSLHLLILFFHFQHRWFQRHFFDQLFMSLNHVFILLARLCNRNIIIVCSIIDQYWNIIIMCDIVDQNRSVILVCSIVDIEHRWLVS